MRLATISVLILAGFVTVCAAQTAPSATSGSLNLSVGGGFSDYDVDWGHGRMFGITAWADYAPTYGPHFLHGLGIEAEARDINFHRSPSQPSDFRLDTIGGGPIYFVHTRFRNLQPYAKYLVDYGGIDWPNPNPHYQHETRTVTAPGAGLIYRVTGHFLARADWEYQSWPDIALQNHGGHVLDPQGVTLGVMYDLRRSQ